MALNRQTGTFIDFDFSFLDLVIGNSYTAIIFAENARWGVQSYSNYTTYTSLKAWLSRLND